MCLSVCLSVCLSEKKKAMNDSTLVKKHGGTAGDPVQQQGKRAWLLGQVIYMDNT